MRGLNRLGLWAVTLLLAAGSAAYAQSDYPNKPIRLVVGFTPGSVPTSPRGCSATAWGKFSGSRLWWRTGPAPPRTWLPNSSLARQRMATRCSCRDSANIANAAINPNLSFDIAKDFAPIALVNAVTVILVVHPSIAVNNVQELIAYAKSKPGELSYASTGLGSAPHFPASCSCSAPGRSLCTCPIRAAPRRPPICWPAARPGDVLARHGRDLAGSGRQAEGAGVDRQQARRRPARPADHDRIRHAVISIPRSGSA